MISAGRIERTPTVISECALYQPVNAYLQKLTPSFHPTNGMNPTTDTTTKMIVTVA